jgi:Mannose-6-phosphate isomerase
MCRSARFIASPIPARSPLELIEVQVGSYLGEDDILRLEDVYRRHAEA